MTKGSSKKKLANADHSIITDTVDLAVFFPDLEEWPKSWRGSDDDILPGEQIVECFRPFLRFLATTYSKRTIRNHADNLWILGGELIRDLNETPKLRKMPIDKLLFDLVQDGGPVLHHADSEERMQSFEATCNKFHRFLESTGAC